MAYRPNPNDPFIAPQPGDDYPRNTDPVLPPNRIEDAGGVSGTRMALYALAVLALIGAVFYGMSTASNTSDTASNPPPSNMAAQRPATPPPAVRDVTPRPNSEPGLTTGAAPSTPAPAANDTK